MHLIRLTILILLILTHVSGFTQNYSFEKDFVMGNITLKDGLQKSGQIKWNVQQNEKLKFKLKENASVEKYSPEDLIGFATDSLKFVSVFNFEAHSDNYALLGKTTTIKHKFAQVVDTGKFNIYFVIITGYNALAGSLQTYPNFLFQKSMDSNYILVSYPVSIRMKDKKYEKAKENLYILFKDYPNIIDKLKNYKQQDSFLEIIDMIKAINRH